MTARTSRDDERPFWRVADAGILLALSFAAVLALAHYLGSGIQ